VVRWLNIFSFEITYINNLLIKYYTINYKLTSLIFLSSMFFALFFIMLNFNFIKKIQNAEKIIISADIIKTRFLVLKFENL